MQIANEYPKTDSISLHNNRKLQPWRNEAKVQVSSDSLPIAEKKKKPLKIDCVTFELPSNGKDVLVQKGLRSRRKLPPKDNWPARNLHAFQIH